MEARRRRRKIRRRKIRRRKVQRRKIRRPKVQRRSNQRRKIRRRKIRRRKVQRRSNQRRSNQRRRVQRRRVQRHSSQRRRVQRRSSQRRSSQRRSSHREVSNRDVFRARSHGIVRLAASYAFFAPTPGGRRFGQNHRNSWIVEGSLTSEKMSNKVGSRRARLAHGASSELGDLSDAHRAVSTEPSRRGRCKPVGWNVRSGDCRGTPTWKLEKN